MEELRSQLEKAIEFFGTNDIVTIMLSQKLDNKILVEQFKNVYQEENYETCI